MVQLGNDKRTEVGASSIGQPRGRGPAQYQKQQSGHTVSVSIRVVGSGKVGFDTQLSYFLAL